MQPSYEKISETEYKKVTEQAPVEVVQTLDALLSQRAEAVKGLENNRAGATYHEELLAKIDAEIAEVKKLGVKTGEEVAEVYYQATNQ